MASIDLTTTAKVKTYLQIDSSETGQDAVIADLVTKASRQILQEFQREFAPTSSATTRTFEAEVFAGDGGFVNLAPYDLRTLTTLKIDTDTATPITLTSAEYRLRPVPNPFGVYDRIELKPLTRIARSIEWKRRQITVLGDWGFASVPEDVEHWCNVQVSAWLPGFKSSRPLSELDDTELVSRTGALSPSVRFGLHHYRRMSFA